MDSRSVIRMLRTKKNWNIGESKRLSLKMICKKLEKPFLKNLFYPPLETMTWLSITKCPATSIWLRPTIRNYSIPGFPRINSLLTLITIRLTRRFFMEATIDMISVRAILQFWPLTLCFLPRLISACTKEEMIKWSGLPINSTKILSLQLRRRSY